MLLLSIESKQFVCAFKSRSPLKNEIGQRAPLIDCEGDLCWLSAAKRQALPEGPRYVPPVPDMQQLDNAAAAFNSQGARCIQSTLSYNAICADMASNIVLQSSMLGS